MKALLTEPGQVSPYYGDCLDLMGIPGLISRCYGVLKVIKDRFPMSTRVPFRSSCIIFPGQVEFHSSHTFKMQMIIFINGQIRVELEHFLSKSE